MLRYATPGVYYERADLSPERPGGLPTDVAGFVGVAMRGPVGTPVRVTSWRQFVSTFGGPHPEAYLGHAVLAFFENGGRAAHVVRAAAVPSITVSDPAAVQPADGSSSIVLPAAGFVAGSVATVRGDGGTVQVTALLVTVDAAGRRLVWAAPLPAQIWTDRQVVLTGPEGAATTSDAVALQPHDRLSTVVRSVAGFRPGTQVSILQTDRERVENHLVNSAEADGMRLVWDEPLPATLLGLPLQFETGMATASATFRNDVGDATLVVTARSPGAWGNRLLVSIVPEIMGSTATAGEQPADRGSSIVDDVGWFRRADLVRAWQSGPPVRTAYLVVSDVDPAERKLWWRNPIPDRRIDPLDGPLPDGFDLRKRTGFEVVAFGLTVSDGEPLREVHGSLSLVPDNPRFAPRQVSVEAGPGGLVQLDVAWAIPPATAASLAPPRATAWLTGGRDGLAALTAADLIGDASGPSGLAAIEPVDEVAIVAVPDAFLRPGPARVEAPVPPPSLDPCCPMVTVPEPPAPPPPPSPVERTPTFTDDAAYRIQAAMVDQCERLRDRFAVLDPPVSSSALEEGVAEVRAWRKRFDTAFAALYFPWVLSRRVGEIQRGGLLRRLPPSGHVAGLYARLDLAEGVHRAPANGELALVASVASEVDDPLHGLLNDEGINAIRAMPGRGIRVFGSRTLSSDTLWRYVNVRRLVSMIEESVEEASQWAVFEPHDPQLRQVLLLGIGGFLRSVWERGALVGATPEEAYFVICDGSNNPPAAVDRGELHVDVGVAPAAPSEFVVFRVGRVQDRVQVTESGGLGALPCDGRA